jgi:hypothetical protein
MRKRYLAIIIFASVGIAYTFATSTDFYVSTGTFSRPSGSIEISVEKSTVHYGDTQTWSAKGLPPDADYVATVRFAGTALIVGTGRADTNGEAAGSFVIGHNIPPRDVIFKLELASNPGVFGETSMNIPSGSIEISVEKSTVHYGDTQTWSAKGLPPDADYVATVRFAGTALIVGTGRADTNGEAAGSFVIGHNIPPGTFAFKVEVASNPTITNEVSIFLAL